jgi:hypothetical protein
MNTNLPNNQQQAANGTPESDKHNEGAGDESSWEGRYNVEVPKLKAAAENGQWAAAKLLEQAERMKDLDSEDFKAFLASKSAKPSESFFSQDDIEELNEIHGEQGAKRYMKDFERMMGAIPKTASLNEVQKGIDSAKESAQHAVFLGAFDAETRAKITNDNSAFMKFSDSLKVGYGTTAKTYIEKIIKGRDSSPEALAYVEQIKEQFEASKGKPQTAPPKGSSPSHQFSAAIKNNQIKSFDSLRPYTKVK